MDAFHRFIAGYNSNEIDLVEQSMEIWGGPARDCAGGDIRVRAYPGRLPSGTGYSFGCPIEPKTNLGFRDGKPIVTMVYWTPEMAGVETRQTGDYACIKIDWIET